MKERRIFIAGCGRSGTSLSRDLMRCFDRTYVHPGEASYGLFASLEKTGWHTVLKRTHSDHNILRDLPEDIDLIYCVRHPYDCLTSSLKKTRPIRRFHITESRWRAEYRALRDLRRCQPGRSIYYLRYEDLVSRPDEIQREIAERFGLEAGSAFALGPAGKSIFRTSVEKWRECPELLDYCGGFGADFAADIGEFCSEFRYRLPSRDRGRPADSEGRTNAWRIEGNPIIDAGKFPAGSPDGANINGPSLILAPDWLPRRLGKYYLYFAHHQGAYIRLAFADRLEGPWQLHPPGTLSLADAPMCQNHIASPDVHVDQEAGQIRMYFHGPIEGGGQKSFVATSRDGIHFKARGEILAGAYLRTIRRQGEWLGLSIDGHLYRSAGGLDGFVRCPARALDFTGQSATLRHSALRTVASDLEIYYSLRGDSPERIWCCTVKTDGDWSDWRGRNHRVVLAPEFAWEGAGLPIGPSGKGAAVAPEHAVRDPALFAEAGHLYLLYAVAGESGIAIARLS